MAAATSVLLSEVWEADDNTSDSVMYRVEKSQPARNFMRIPRQISVSGLCARRGFRSMMAA